MKLPTIKSDDLPNEDMRTGQFVIAAHDERGVPWQIGYYAATQEGLAPHILGMMVEAEARGWPEKTVARMMVEFHEDFRPINQGAQLWAYKVLAEASPELGPKEIDNDR